MKKIFTAIILACLAMTIVSVSAAKHPATALKARYECTVAGSQKKATFTVPIPFAKHPYLPVGSYIFHLK